MNYVPVLAVLLLGLIGAALILVRIAPVDPAVLHVSPATAPGPKGSGIRLRGARSPVFDHDPAIVIAALKTVASQKRRVRLIAETSDPARVTFEARTKWLGFPDDLTFEAQDQDGGARLDVLARSRFGGYDWGVNSARVERWLSDLRIALGQNL